MFSHISTWKDTMSWIWKYILYWFQLLALKIIRTGQIPKHVAIIMDGNRRYAKKQKMAQIEGHKKGSDKMTEIVDWCKELGITEVTLYAFSIDNFNRTKDEVDELMELIKYKINLLTEENKYT